MPPLENDKTGARPLVFTIPAKGRAADPRHSCESLGGQGKPGLVLGSSGAPSPFRDLDNFSDASVSPSAKLFDAVISQPQSPIRWGEAEHRAPCSRAAPSLSIGGAWRRRECGWRRRRSCGRR